MSDNQYNKHKSTKTKSTKTMSTKIRINRCYLVVFSTKVIGLAWKLFPISIHRNRFTIRCWRIWWNRTNNRAYFSLL